MERYKRILVPIDGSELSKLAFEQALSLAKMVNGDVTVIHIIEPYTPGTFDFDVYEIMNSIEIIEEKTKNAMESQLNELVELGKERNVTVNSIIKKGNVSDELIKESSNTKSIKNIDKDKFNNNIHHAFSDMKKEPLI